MNETADELAKILKEPSVTTSDIKTENSKLFLKKW